MRRTYFVIDIYMCNVGR